MKIEKCTINLKCDANGCHNKAKHKISFDGTSWQIYICEDCGDKLYKSLKEKFGGKKYEGK